jgi:hypothetical protein
MPIPKSDYNHPSFYDPELSQERLVELCNEVLDVVTDAFQATNTNYDTRWTRGVLIYGRVQGYFRHLHQFRCKSWLTLEADTMDFTFKIGSTLIQFVRDDFLAPKKTHRLKANSTEQMSLDFLSDTQQFQPITVWRLFVDNSQEDDLMGLDAALVGFDDNQTPVCVWRYKDVASIPVTTVEKPAAVEIDDADVVRRDTNDQTKINS